MKRRTLLQAASMASIAPLGFAARNLLAADAASVPVRRLLLVELNGGNDGLNTLIPYADPLYLQLRPQLAVARDQVLQLDEHVGFNPALAALMPLYAARELALVQGLGYARANRSHFRSIEIWDTATDSDKIGTDGWLSRLDVQRRFGRSFAADAVVIGRNPKPATGADMQPVVMGDADSFVSESRGVEAMKSASDNPALKHILAVQRDIQAAGHELSSSRPSPAGDFPKSPFGRDASEAARLLIGNPATPIVKIALTGFDTHVMQRGRQDGLLKQFGDTMAALRTAFTSAGIWKDTLIVTYSEFGRRAQQNASGGTDHGKAAPHFVIGGAVKGGLYGEPPRFAKLDDGDVPATIDYRCVYNTVLGRWWNAGDAQIEPQRFKPLALV
ncbi:MAG: hypothetical protein JWQ90_3756 [Hydrocarboniphaga sp.]|uniref:DUF1501 domain-containing protein n=1 Tax=Hydrocarboniphaga sp. TaxID=2033016 RepID=UPI002636D0F2|nr:DUF1501 domain-containing protein [Hydrocarboniphaga sp.]MDB5971306.1 hypothetical protein [Hydrocarboniphaga sp.]